MSFPSWLVGQSPRSPATPKLPLVNQRCRSSRSRNTALAHQVSLKRWRRRQPLATGGAFAAYMFGVGATEMLGVLVTGEIWLTVPHTIAMEFDGAFAPGVSAKDAMLFYH